MKRASALFISAIILLAFTLAGCNQPQSGNGASSGGAAGTAAGSAKKAVPQPQKGTPKLMELGANT